MPSNQEMRATHTLCLRDGAGSGQGKRLGNNGLGHGVSHTGHDGSGNLNGVGDGGNSVNSVSNGSNVDGSMDGVRSGDSVRSSNGDL